MVPDLFKPGRRATGCKKAKVNRKSKTKEEKKESMRIKVLKNHEQKSDADVTTSMKPAGYLKSRLVVYSPLNVSQSRFS